MQSLSPPRNGVLELTNMQAGHDDALEPVVACCAVCSRWIREAAEGRKPWQELRDKNETTQNGAVTPS